MAPNGKCEPCNCHHGDPNKCHPVTGGIVNKGCLGVGDQENVTVGWKEINLNICLVGCMEISLKSYYSMMSGWKSVNKFTGSGCMEIHYWDGFNGN